MLVTRIHRLGFILSGVLLAGLSLSVLAQELTPAHYVELDIAVRQATLDGVEERLALLRAGVETDVIQQRDADTRQTITALYRQYGTTAPQAVAWATRNREAIEDWLAKNPEYQSEYHRLARLLDATSNELQSFALSTDR
ncbi:hypothetical protein [Saccharospirillum impatiens]|uniref:hypothetical protein n=1 Tax=Saccharospirillum impatiens TaxID=169438 RepID=UPI000429CF1F|nr:hypothetical protein [Saccharospirillum impatiens]